jgi:hypothetical protein
MTNKLALDSTMLLSIARSRLKIVGDVTIKAVTQSEASSPEFGFSPAVTSSNDDASKHLIKYDESRLDDSGLLHELCHVKLNEIGFKKVEAAIAKKALECPSEEERIEMKKAVVFIAEIYANYMLFRYFKAESEKDRRGLDGRFLVAQAIRIIVRESGYLGIVSAAGHRTSKRWNGYDEDDAFKWAFEEAFKGKREHKTYTEIHSTMSKLPLIRECAGEIQNFTSEDIGLIEECVLKLFKNQETWRHRSGSKQSKPSIKSA